MRTPMVPIGIFLTAAGLMGELAVGRFKGFFDWAYIQKAASEPVKLLMTRFWLVSGVVLLIVGGLIEVAAAIQRASLPK